MDNFLFLSHLPNRYLLQIEKRFKNDLFPTSQELVRFCLNLQRIEDSTEIPKNAAEKALDLAIESEQICKWEGIHSISFWSEDYPEKLRNIENPPFILFFQGNLPSKNKTLSVVGTRQPDAYGIKSVGSILSKLNTRPIQVVSGLAEGIDSLAHSWACELEIPNWAVLGSGVDVIYPESNKNLARRILKGGGGILSEFAPATKPKPFHFPRRNRIISALSDVLWVVQGTFKSGTRHTIDYACKQSKTVAAVPGEIFNPLSEVPNRLILEGAHSVLCPLDLDLLLASK